MIVGTTTLLAISTLTSEINFYTRLMRMKDPATGRPIFQTISIRLACDKCIEDGKQTECIHLLHLVPRWQSSERHMKLKTVMQDRPDLLQSELSGLAFDSLAQAFRPSDIDLMFADPGRDPVINEQIFIVIDPAAGGFGSDYCVLSFVRHKGTVMVS
jgi:hypothetical protein